MLTAPEQSQQKQAYNFFAEKIKKSGDLKITN